MSKIEHFDAKWHPIEKPPILSNSDVMLWGKRGWRKDDMVRAFYENGKWYRILTRICGDKDKFACKPEPEEFEIKGEELDKYGWWLEINPPFEIRNNVLNKFK